MQQRPRPGPPAISNRVSRRLPRRRGERGPGRRGGPGTPARRRAGSEGLTTAGAGRGAEPNGLRRRRPPPGCYHNNRAAGPAAPAEPGPGAAPSAGRPSAVRRQHAAAGGGEGENPGPAGACSCPPPPTRATFTSSAGARTTPRKERCGGGGRQEPAPLLPREGRGPRDSPAEEGPGFPLPRARDPPSPATPLGRARAHRQPHPPSPHPRQGSPRRCRGIPSLPAQVSAGRG